MNHLNSENKIEHEITALKNKYAELSNYNKKLSTRVEELELYLEINLLLSSNLDRDDTLAAIKNFFKTRFAIDEYSLLLPKQSGNNYKVVSSFGINDLASSLIKIHSQLNPWAQVLHNRKSVYLKDLSSDQENISQIGHIPQGSMQVLPLISETNHVIGILNLKRNKTDNFTEKELDQFNKIAHQITLVIDKTILFHQAKELAFSDALTSIFNRRYFDQRYEREILRARRYNRHLSVLMIDIDHFKIYNDTFGHLLGDKVLRKVALTLEKNLRRADVLCRYGGEEFVVLLPEIDLMRGAYVAEKLRTAILQEPFEGEEELPIQNLTVSIGIASFPETGDSAEVVLDRADQALYEAKNAGRNRVKTGRNI